MREDGEHLNLAHRPNPPAPFPTREGGAERGKGEQDL